VGAGPAVEGLSGTVAEPFRIVDPEGRLVGEPPEGLGEGELHAMLRSMLLGRRIDQKAISLQRRGKLGTYAPLSGQEAASVGSVFAIDRATDWLVPQYREQLAMLHMGLGLSTYLLQRMGHPAGAEIPAGANLYPQQVALAAHLPHAVGLAWGLQLTGREAVVLTYFGDGASSEGDFHEACNLAGIRRAPVIMVCQNNGWAISTPWSIQSAAETVASRAEGYGMPGVLVDGNDVLAMYEMTRQARARALAGDGPTLIEAVTTRLGAHTTADDPTRYVAPEQAEAARALDPIVRFKAWLRATDRWDDEADALAVKWCDDEIDRAVEEFDATPKPRPGAFFDDVYAEPPERLKRQREQFLAERAEGEEG
jgi:pyruvate dehydrogenase E1 component alpha subunit